MSNNTIGEVVTGLQVLPSLSISSVSETRASQDQTPAPQSECRTGDPRDAPGITQTRRSSEPDYRMILYQDGRRRQLTGRKRRPKYNIFSFVILVGNTLFRFGR